MQYSEVEELFPSISSLYLTSVNSGKPVDVIVKEFLKNRKNYEQWNRSHIETSIIRDVKRIDNDYGYQLVVTTDNKSPRGGETKDTRSVFFNDDGTTANEWMSLVGRQCMLYVAYNENSEDHTVFRILLDIEPR